MNPTRYEPPSSQSIYEDIFSDDFTGISNRRDEAQELQSQLTSIIGKDQADALQQLVQQHRETWSLVSPEELGKWLLIAVQKGHLDIVDALIRESVPATAAAISLDMQLELVEAARLGRNSELEMSQLLDALLRTVSRPVQHLALLVDKAKGQQYFAIATSLFAYKENFVKARNSQSLQSIYDAAADGDAARLQKELDAKLGIPPLDEKLTGPAWLFNMLHRWMAELFTKSAAKELVNASMKELPLLHAAVESGSKETVLLLIEKGADISTSDKHGHTALSKAEDKKNREIVALLKDLHAPDRASVPGDAPALTQAASGRRSVEGLVHRHPECTTGRPGYNDIVETFKNLLPDVASDLSRSKDLATKLNGAESMSAQQAELFSAGYLAEFVPPEAVDGQKSSRAQVSQTDDVLLQLQVNCDKFRAEGRRLEASKEEELHRGLDSLISSVFDELLPIPGHIQSQPRRAGLCNLLIALIEQAVAEARKEKGWLSPSNGARKQIFIACLRAQLQPLSNKRAAMKSQDASQTLSDRLLGRQIALLENYCKAADGAGQETDFSADFC
jgi:hypothetical protein